MNYISIPSGLLLFEKSFEREFRQSKTNVISPLFMSIYRHLCHLPGSWECYKKPISIMALLGIERHVSGGEAL